MHKISLIFSITVSFSLVSVAIPMAFANPQYDYGLKIEGENRIEASEQETTFRITLLSNSEGIGGRLLVVLPKNWKSSAPLHEDCQYAEIFHSISCLSNLEPGTTRSYNFSLEKINQDICEDEVTLDVKALSGITDNEDPNMEDNEITLTISEWCPMPDLKAEFLRQTWEDPYLVHFVHFTNDGDPTGPAVLNIGVNYFEAIQYVSNDKGLDCKIKPPLSSRIFCENVDISQPLTVAFVYKIVDRSVCEKNYIFSAGIFSEYNTDKMQRDANIDNNNQRQTYEARCLMPDDYAINVMNVILSNEQVLNYEVYKDEQAIMLSDKVYEWRVEPQLLYSEEDIENSELRIEFPEEFFIASVPSHKCERENNSFTCTNISDLIYKWGVTVPIEYCTQNAMKTSTSIQYFVNGYKEYMIDEAVSTCKPNPEEGQPTDNQSSSSEWSGEDPAVDDKDENNTQIVVQQSNGLLLSEINGEQIVMRDVPANSWFAPYVQLLIQRGTISGYQKDGKPTGLFGPGDNVTYAQIAKIAIEAMDIGLGPFPKNPIAQNHWSKRYIGKMENRVSIYSDYTLDITKPAPRGAVVQILYELNMIPASISTGSYYDDVSTENEYAGYIEKATDDGVVAGDGGSNTFRPNDPVNRAETTKIVTAFIKRYGY